jgi:hypothetical protein
LILCFASGLYQGAAELGAHRRGIINPAGDTPDGPGLPAAWSEGKGDRGTWMNGLSRHIPRYPAKTPSLLPVACC